MLKDTRQNQKRDDFTVCVSMLLPFPFCVLPPLVCSDYPYPASFIAPMPAYPVNVTCGYFDTLDTIRATRKTGTSMTQHTHAQRRRSPTMARHHRATPQTIRWGRSHPLYLSFFSFSLSLLFLSLVQPTCFTTSLVRPVLVTT